MISFTDKRFFFLFSIVASLFLCFSCMYYIYINSTPFPFWDMWNGNVSFVAEFMKTGDWNLLLQQHNEHRIVITRLLFILDEIAFGGNYSSLYFWNALFPFIFLVLYISTLAKCINIQKNLIFVILAFGVVFSLIQHNNYEWAFQSQFFLAFLVPFGAYFSWSLYNKSSKIIFLFATCLLLIASSGTMANGIFATIPLLFLELISYRRWRVLTIFTILQAALAYLYFHNYHSVGGHGNIQTSLIEQPINFILYIFTYVGSAFPGIFGTIIGFLEVSYILFLCKKYLLNNERPSRQMELLLFALFIFMTALLTAIGRANFGLETAHSSRYTTPGIYGFLCVVGLFYSHNQNLRKYINISMAFISLILVVSQIGYLSKVQVKNQEFWNRAAVISFLQNTPDTKTFNQYSYPHDSQTETIQSARDQKTSLIGKPPYVNMNTILGSPHSSALPEKKCFGHVDKIYSIDNTDAVTLRGWIYNPSGQSRYNLLKAINNNNIILGLGTTGEYRQDLREALGRKEADSGFWIYFRNSNSAQQPLTIILETSNGSCFLSNF